MIWERMSNGAGQRTGDIYNLHGYAHPRNRLAPADWTVYRHTEVVARGSADTLGDARAAVERVIAAL